MMVNNGQTLVLCELCLRLWPVAAMARRGDVDFICRECDESDGRDELAAAAGAGLRLGERGEL